MDQIIQALHLRNWYAVAALSLLLLVQLFRKLPKTSDLWQKIPDGYRWVVPMVSGAVAGFTQAFAGGLPIADALLAALGGAIGISIPAMGLNSLLTESPVRWNGGAGGLPVASKPPPDVSGLGALLLAVCFAVHVSACSLFGAQGSFWPKVEKCAPSPASLVSQVADILVAGGDYEAALKALALQDGAAAVICAVQAFVNSTGHKVGAGTDELSGVARGKAFLAEHPVSE